VKDWRIKLDFTCVCAIALTAIIALCGCRTEASDTEPIAVAFEPTTEATVAETTEAVTEPTEIETLATEATEPEETKPVETEPPVVLYDVPLDADLQLHIIETAEEHGIDPAIVFAMAWIESSYKADNVGDSGASLGLLQIQPRWHSGRMEKLGCSDLFDPFQNVTVGVDYLAELIGRYGEIGAALTSYNRGHYNGTVTDYAWAVMNKADELRGSTYVHTN
jgi:soluble lytic murein transglycosylase-like protein